MLTGLLLGAAKLAAQGAVGEFQFPSYPIGPQTVALGGAGAALARDAESGLNPASLIAAPRLSIHHFEGYVDYAGNLIAGSLLLFGRHAAGVSFRRFDWDRVIEDDLGVGTDGLKTGDSKYTLTLAVALTRSLHVGFAGSRLVTDNLGVRTTATSWSAGAMVQYARSGRFGVALLHAGGPATVEDGENRYPLPTRLRAGVTQSIPAPAGRLSVVLDAEVPPRAVHVWTGHAGLEWRAPSILVLRCGVASLANPNTVGRETRWAAGLGLIVGRLEIGLAVRFGSVVGGYESFIGFDAFRPSTASERPVQTP